MKTIIYKRIIKVNTNDNFNYTYSAKEMDEIRAIKEKYQTSDERPEETPIERLRRLDRSAERVPTVVALVLGIVGILIMGFGMSMIMTELGEMVSTAHFMPIGIIIGVLGGAVAGVAYPVFGILSKRARKKIAPEILKLTEELASTK